MTLFTNFRRRFVLRLHSFHNLLERLVMNVLVRRRDETFEQRMRLVRLAQKFRMKLARQKKWMVFQFNHLDQFAVGRIATQNESGFLEFFAVGVVEFVAVTMPFVDDKRAVKLARLGTDDKLDRKS